MKIRAAVLESIGAPAPYAASRPLVVQSVELDPPGPGEVLIRVGAAGLCHSDLSVINGDRPRPVPMVLGHESAGTVVDCAPDVKDLRPGDRVVLVFVPSCGHCVPCAEGRPALCEPGAAANAAGTLLSGERRLHRAGAGADSADGPPPNDGADTRGAVLQHHIGVSCFAEYAVVSRRSCVKLEADISDAEAALFGCAVLTGVGAVINTARLQAGSTAAILGLGGVGLNALLAAVASGAREIVAIDLNPEKLALARDLGATLTFDATSPTLIDDVRDATRGGVDVALEMAGSVRALETAYRITRRGGSTITGGLPNPAHQFSFSPVSLVAEERTLRGSYIGSSIPTRDIPRYVDLYRRGKLPVDRLMGERMRLDDINAGFDRLAGGHTLRDVVVFD